MIQSAETPSPLLDTLAKADVPKKDVAIAEAKFGLKYIRPYLEGLPAHSRVLEVGCGSGVLMGLLKERFPQLQCEGVEPFGDGFAAIESINHHIRRQGIAIARMGYEQLQPDAPYDVIYSVNVFEHLQDWRHFLRFVKQHLAPNGVCVILCPNYGFPYESHFKLPVVVNKTITARLFRNAIVRHEAKQDAHGLWNSLNFVKLRHVRAEVAKLPLSLTVRHRIITEMVERLGTDEAFRKRQRVIGRAGALVHRSGIIGLFRFPFFQNFMPYMQLEIRHSFREGKP